MAHRLLFIILLLQLVSCVPLGTLPTSGSDNNETKVVKNKLLIYDDHNYESYVGNVILNSTNIFAKTSSAQPLTLEFDLLTSQFENLQARIVHCNFDWKPSQLREIQYLDAFNRFDHKSFEYSTNTRTRYIQYFFEVARPKISGNYLVILSKRDNPNDILFTRRLVLFEDRIKITPSLRIPRVVKDRRTHQQLDFTINFNGFEAPNPNANFKTILMQNKNWDSAIENLKPTSIQPTVKEMRWEYFSGENQFPGWNQFRWLDLRTLTVRGMNVVKIQESETRVDVYQNLDSDHGSHSYRQLINDNNGRMIPGNSDPGATWLQADYVTVHFTLKSAENVGSVFLSGRFNDWERNDKTRMIYNSDVGAYELKLFLKQGFYDYRYEVESTATDVYHFEGSHFQAENEYDILVYYRAPGQIHDQVVGLSSINSEAFF